MTVKNSFANDILTLFPEGQVDSNNAAALEQEIFALTDTHQPKTILVDASQLKYISSAGLRVILKLKKAYSSTSVVNVSSEVYEIFNVTGFTDILDVKKALRQLSVDGCPIIGKGGHGTVYRIDRDTIIKVYNAAVPIDEIEREMSYAKTAFVYGIPTAISYDMVKVDDRYGVVFELIDADTLTSHLVREPENFAQYASKYASLVHTLHTTEVDTDRFSSTKALYHQWADDMHMYLSEEEIAILHELISSIPDRKTLVHGDIHPNNIMVQNGEMVLIDLADLTYGHPIFDYAGIALTHVLSGRNNPAITPQIIGIEYQTSTALWKTLIQAAYGDRSEADYQRTERLLLAFAMLKYAITPAINQSQDPRLTPSILKNARENFFPHAKALIGAIDF